MGSGRTFDRRGESEGTGVRVLSCLGEGRTGGRGLATILVESDYTSDDSSTLTKLENILASGMFLLMHLVMGILISELRLSVPGEDRKI